MQKGLNAEAVDLALAWLQTRALGLAGQAEHQMLFLPELEVSSAFSSSWFDY